MLPRVAAVSSPATDVVVVDLPEPLGADAAPVVLRRLGAVGAGSGPVQVDLGRVRRVDAFGLAALAAALRQLRAAGREVRVVGVAPEVRRRAALLRLDQALGAPEAPPAPRRARLDAPAARAARTLDAAVVLTR